MRRGGSVQQLYADAVDLTERGKSLALEATTHNEATRCFNDAIRIFNRLAIVESAAKREMIQSVVVDLRQQIERLKEPRTADDMLTKAMEIHAAAREAEDRGDREKCIELYLSAGDWYMKAYTSFGPGATSAKAAVREQIEYVIDHVSKLKEANHAAESTHVAPPPLEQMQWPMPPAGSPLLTAATTAPSPPSVADSVALPETAWPMAPLASPVLQSGVSQVSVSSEPSAVASGEASGGNDGLAWPLPPGASDALDAFDWPMPPVLQHPKRRSFRQSNPPSRASSSDQLIPAAPPAALRQLSSSLSSSSLTQDHASDDNNDDSVSYSLTELDVLRRSSQINGHIFVPWLDDLDAHENFRSVNLFVDPDGNVPLSAKQIRKGAVWMRPSEYAALCKELPVMINSICPQVVKQDIVTDCSFVASLCIAAAYEQRFHKPLITNIIFPMDPQTKQPMYNPSGKYIVKLWANGVPRKIVIDDFLPVDTQTKELLCSCTTRRNELWVSLIEKAYLKLHGGYDYPGGNSGIDLFALTGWIPERIAICDLVDDYQKEDRIWEQLKSAFHFGDCIITMTTGEIAKDDAKEIGLVPMHVYAVLNVYETTVVVDETSGQSKKLRLLHVKNPWRKLSWRGPFSKRDTKTWQGAVGEELRKYQSQYYAPSTDAATATVDGVGGGTGSTDTDTGTDTDDGLFWIDLESVKRHFDSLYLNWNPSLFPHKYAIHEHWPLALGPANDSVTLGYNPQYSLRFTRRRRESSVVGDPSSSSSSSSSVWVLLTRHVSTVERDVPDSDETGHQQFLTLHVYRQTDGRRVFYNQDAMHRGTYSNNPHTLLSLDVDFSDDDPEPTFTLVASQYEKFAPLDYTLSVFSTTPFVCRPVPHLDAMPNSVVVQGQWDQASAGGRPFYASFMENPQYHVQLSGGSGSGRVWIFLETTPSGGGGSDAAAPPVNLRVITHTRERVCGLPATASTRKRILSSGEYRPGFCFVEVDLSQELTSLEQASDPSHLLDVVLVPSTFEPHTVASFQIRIAAVVDGVSSNSMAFHIQPLPEEASGLMSTILAGRWDVPSGTAVGCASYGCYTFNPRYLVFVHEEQTSFFVRLVAKRIPSSTTTSSILCSTDGSVLPSCNVSIFASNSDGNLLLSTNPKTSFRHATSENGAYASGNRSGVCTPKGILFPCGWYVVLPSTYDPQETEFELKMYSSKRITVRQIKK